MRMTLEEIIEDATIYGYDFGALISRKENKMDYREYIYGYSLANDKESYLEALCENKVENCDRLYLFQDKLDAYFNQIKSIPHTKLISGFRILDYAHSIYGNSVYRIMSINENKGTAFVVDIEYVADNTYEALSVLKAEIEYEEAMKTIETSGYQILLDKAERLAGIFVVLPEIEIQ